MRAILFKYLVGAVIALSAFSSDGRASDAITGHLYLTVDDHAVVYLNGKPLMEGHWDKRDKIRKSGLVQVKVGDRLVFQLENTLHSAFLAVQFVSNDLETMIHFPAWAFRQLRDPAAKDFEAISFSFNDLPSASKRRTGPGYLPFKSDSEGVWGETDLCALGVVIKAQMIRPLRN